MKNLIFFYHLNDIIIGKLKNCRIFPYNTEFAAILLQCL